MLLKGDFPHPCRNEAGNELCDNPKLTVDTPLALLLRNCAAIWNETKKEGTKIQYF